MLEMLIVIALLLVLMLRMLRLMDEFCTTLVLALTLMDEA